MRRLSDEEARALAQRIADDPRTAQAHFAIEVGAAAVWETSGSEAQLVVPRAEVSPVQVLGMPPEGELMDFLRPMPLEGRVLMSRHLYARFARMVAPRSVLNIELYTGAAGMSPDWSPPPDATHTVRPLLHADVAAWSTLPPDTTFLHAGHGAPQDVISRGSAVGALENGRILSLATAESGRTFSTIWAYTVPEARGRGLATHCVVALIDQLRSISVRPLFSVIAVNGCPERAMARRLGMELSGELAMVERRHMAV